MTSSSLPFRLSDTGRPIPEPGPGGAATSAGGGRGTGAVHHRTDGPVPDRAVLVTATLDLAIAPDLPRLAGLVAETGNVLSHLAILAREAGVPIVVGAAGATGDLTPGERITVDGDTGDVIREETRCERWPGSPPPPRWAGQAPTSSCTCTGGSGTARSSWPCCSSPPRSPSPPALLMRAARRATATPSVGGADPDGRILEHIQASRPRRAHFAWLRPADDAELIAQDAPYADDPELCVLLAPLHRRV